MATVVLHCKEGLRTRFNKHRPSPNPSPIPILSQSRRSQKRCSTSDQPRTPMVIKHPAKKNLLMGQVRILKRGEEMPRCLVKKDETSEFLKKQIEVCMCSSNIEPDVLDFFSGWSFFASPSPSSVPIPRLLANGVLSLDFL